MDLLTIKKNIDSGVIRTTAEFQRDMMLMFINAMMYNNVEHDVHKMAVEMYGDVMMHIEVFFKFGIDFSIFAIVLLLRHELGINVTVTSDIIEDGTDEFGIVHCKIHYIWAIPSDVMMHIEVSIGYPHNASQGCQLTL